MSPAEMEVLTEFLQAYGKPPRPATFGNPEHCEECLEANELLMDRTPEDLEADELLDSSKGWFFAWMGSDGWRYFLPGFVRVTLAKPDQHLCVLLNRLDKDNVQTLETPQCLALHTVLKYLQSGAYAYSNRERESLRQALNLVERG